MATPSPPRTRAVSSATADPTAAKAAEIRELIRMATRKITPVSRLSWNITSPTPRKKPWARFANGQAPGAGGELPQLRLDRCLRVGREGGDQLAWADELELVDGEQQQPGGEHERGGQRRHVPGGEQVAQGHHHDRGDRRAQDDVDGE